MVAVVFFFRGKSDKKISTIKTNYLQQELDASTVELEQIKQNTQDQVKKIADVEKNAAIINAEKERLTLEVSRLNNMLDALQKENQIKSISLAEAAQQQKALDEKIVFLNETKEQFAMQFQNLANTILEEKGTKLDQQGQKMLEGLVTPLREQIQNFKAKVEYVYEQETRERASLKTELLSLKHLNEQITQETINLTKALKGESKAQGNWGEVILERVLEGSGLRKGHEYDTQLNLKDRTGARRMPDVVVHLPDNKDIVIDAKVSLTAYERFCSADDESERKLHLKDHLNSIRSHIKLLSVKDYEGLEGINSLDFVFIFIPVEAAFMTALEHDPSIFSDAYNKSIIVVSPTTLLATMKTVQSIWRYEQQNRYAEKIANSAGDIHDQLVLVVESLEDVKKHIHRTDEAFDQAMKRLATGRGNVIGKVLQLKKLGAKTKKQMPKQVMLGNEDIEDDEDYVLSSTSTTKRNNSDGE